MEIQFGKCFGKIEFKNILLHRVKITRQILSNLSFQTFLYYLGHIWSYRWNWFMIQVGMETRHLNISNHIQQAHQFRHTGENDVFEVRNENLPKICKNQRFRLYRGILESRLCFYYPYLFICEKIFLIWVCFGPLTFFRDLFYYWTSLVNYQFILLGLVRGYYIIFFQLQIYAASQIINVSFSFICLWQNNLSLQRQRLYTNLSKINQHRDVIHILKVLRYKVISRSKFFSNTFGSQVQGYL